MDIWECWLCWMTDGPRSSSPQSCSTCPGLCWRVGVEPATCTLGTANTEPGFPEQMQRGWKYRVVRRECTQLRSEWLVTLPALEGLHCTRVLSTTAEHHYKELWGPGESDPWEHAVLSLLSPALYNCLWMFSN